VRVLIDYRPALRQRTGVGEYAHLLAAALVRRLGPEGSLVLFSSSWKDRLAPSPIPGASTIDRRIPVSMLNRAWHRFEWPPVELLAGAVDVAHSMHPLLIPTRNAAQVVTIHDLHFLDHPEHTEAEIRRDYAALAPTHARRADAIVVVSEHMAAQVRTRLNIPADRITVCAPGAPSWPRRPNPVRDGPILFMGTLEARKNVPTLLTAYERLLQRMPGSPDLVLAGRATESAAPILQRLTNPPLAGRARHLGYVSDESRQQLYRDASMLVLPSFYEGFGTPVLEAMTVGVPVVVADRGALPEVVGGAGLVIDAENSGELADAMERILTDSALAAQCAERGIERSRQFSWDASASRLATTYIAAIEHRARRTA
jgi:glycosyltransferase involved in cell wall biosynthesis